MVKTVTVVNTRENYDLLKKHVYLTAREGLENYPFIAIHFVDGYGAFSDRVQGKRLSDSDLKELILLPSKEAKLAYINHCI